MKQISAQQKHSILTHYTARRKGETLAEILRLHDVSASRTAVFYWMQQWDGTVDSLQHKGGAGRPRILSQQEVTRHMGTPIRNKNRAAVRVKYIDIQQQVQDRTRKQVSIQTIRRYGKDELGARFIRGKKRTREESKYIDT
jgi:hypothetical protein